MAVYPLSWIYYLVFIFLNTFAFLNMLIGIVVNVMEQERAEEHEEAHKYDMTIEDLSAQLEELKALIKTRS
jgi:voltage-gated sodium channel